MGPSWTCCGRTMSPLPCTAWSSTALSRRERDGWHLPIASSSAQRGALAQPLPQPEAQCHKMAPVADRTLAPPRPLFERHARLRLNAPACGGRLRVHLAKAALRHAADQVRDFGTKSPPAGRLQGEPHCLCVQECSSTDLAGGTSSMSCGASSPCVLGRALLW